MATILLRKTSRNSRRKVAFANAKAMIIMMKLKEIHPYPNMRVFLLRLLGRLHCALLAAMGCGALFTIFHQGDVEAEFTALFPALAAISPLEAYLRGLLFAIPVALSFYAIRLCPKLWQFLLCAALLCGLIWFLMGHPIGMVLTALCCFFRARKRLAEEVEESGFDRPSYLGLSLFALTFLISAIMGNVLLQKLSVFSAAVYLLLCLCDRGLRRLDEYLRLNETMYGLPSRRIQRIAGGALAISLVLAAALLLPAAVGVSGDFTVDLTRKPSVNNWEVQETETPEESDQPQGVSLDEMFGGEIEPLFQIPPIVSYLIYAVIVAALAAMVLYFIYRLILSFRRSFTDSRDQVQYLSKTREDRDERSSAVRSRRPGVLDRSPNALIRRRYRKQVLRSGQEPPRPSYTPRELEAAAGLSVPVLHALYEKARYGNAPCTAEDVRAMKNEE